MLVAHKLQSTFTEEQMWIVQPILLQNIPEKRQETHLFL